MKKKLLILMVAVMTSVTSVKAQKVWNFSDDTVNWITSTAGYSANTIKDNLGIYPAVTTTSPTIGGIIPSSVNFSDGFNATRYFRMGQASVFTGNQPTERYLYFATAGAGTIKIWFTSGGGGSRSVKVTDGTNQIGVASSANSTTPAILEAPYTQTSGNIYIYTSVGTGVNIYKIEVTGVLGTTTLIPALGTDDFKTDTASQVYSDGKQVFVSNVKSTTAIDVYSISGILVKSLETESDTSFSLNSSGFYIVKAKSAEGIKTVKILSQ
ncbi:T9SS type A sorting domain-containing protein [Flavobacterium pectinovorum]|uniref:T9SS type A sorting domain-containing protein n=1 Tax=Flavobacterium pectinovorum TaxID=29533 RepID=UPI001FACAAF5|nr:T9SS type A sorting domain-containing protein [Flavobacterium pectinovorum]MCI9845983.1 T9SS type A sorting domain-containing protein [Flavobacterium pectinovorum]